METKDLRRALRRHHVQRLKRARAGYWGRDRTLSPRQLGIAVGTSTPCSCWMCGNPRRFLTGDLPNGLTVQEVKQRLFAQSFDDERGSTTNDTPCSA